MSTVPLGGAGSRWQRFGSTRWSMVTRAGRGSGDGSRQALEELCAAYWAPIYGFVCARGHDAAGAEDLTQAFFADLIERRAIEDADPTRGRFRTYLLAC